MTLRLSLRLLLFSTLFVSHVSWGASCRYFLLGSKVEQISVGNFAELDKNFWRETVDGWNTTSREKRGEFLLNKVAQVDPLFGSTLLEEIDERQVIVQPQWLFKKVRWQMSMRARRLVLPDHNLKSEDDVRTLAFAIVNAYWVSRLKFEKRNRRIFADYVGGEDNWIAYPFVAAATRYDYRVKSIAQQADDSLVLWEKPALRPGRLLKTRWYSHHLFRFATIYMFASMAVSTTQFILEFDVDKFSQALSDVENKVESVESTLSDEDLTKKIIDENFRNYHPDR